MLKDKLKQAAAAALKSGEPEKVEALRFLVSLIDKKELQLPPGKMEEEDEVAVLRKELKNKEEAREMFVKGKRDDLVIEVDYEIEVLRPYLPREMSEEEVRKVVKQVMTESDLVNFGQIMGEVMKRVAGRAGGDRVAKIVKEEINES